MKYRGDVTISRTYEGVEVEADDEEQADELMAKMTEDELRIHDGNPVEEQSVENLDCEDYEEEEEDENED